MSPSQTPAVLGEEQPPQNNDSDSSSITYIPGPRPEVVQGVRLFSNITTSPKVVSTNAGLAIITLVVLLLTAAIFNQTLEENDADVRALMKMAAKPFRGYMRWQDRFSTSMFGKVNPLRSIAPSLIALAIAAGIYGLEEPDFGLNTQSLVLFISYLGAFALVTYTYDGVQLLMSKRYGVEAAIRVFPTGVAVALICVVMTRISGFVPGLMYGFVASHTLIGKTKLTDEQEGKQVFYPTLFCLGACLLAWWAAGPLRDFSKSEDTWWSAIPEGIAIGLFASGLQSLFLQLIPIRYMDGHKLIRWSKPAWLLVSLISGFLFWEVLLNADEDSVDALKHTSTVVALAIIVGCLIFTIVVWAGFRLYKPQEERATG